MKGQLATQNHPWLYASLTVGLSIAMLALWYYDVKTDALSAWSADLYNFLVRK